MADVLRLKKYTTFMDDGRSSTTWKVHPGRVIVAVVVGYEPAKMAGDGKDECPIDEVILAMAKHITKQRRKQAAPAATAEKV